MSQLPHCPQLCKNELQTSQKFRKLHSETHTILKKLLQSINMKRKCSWTSNHPVLELQTNYTTKMQKHNCLGSMLPNPVDKTRVEVSGKGTIHFAVEFRPNPNSFMLYPKRTRGLKETSQRRSIWEDRWSAIIGFWG